MLESVSLIIPISNGFTPYKANILLTFGKSTCFASAAFNHKMFPPLFIYSVIAFSDNCTLKDVTIKSNTIDTYKVTIGGKTVEMSPKHQLYIIDKGWVRAYDLNVNDKLLDVNGKQVSISKIEYKKYDSPIDTYNLTIEGNNNYFVTDIQVLVHNAGSPTV